MSKGWHVSVISCRNLDGQDVSVSSQTDHTIVWASKMMGLLALALIQAQAPKLV